MHHFFIQGTLFSSVVLATTAWLTHKIYNLITKVKATIVVITGWISVNLLYGYLLTCYMDILFSVLENKW